MMPVVCSVDDACAAGQAVLRDQRRHAPRCQQLTSCRGFAADAGSGAPRAAALIIGNEILSGSITDTNTPWLAKLLHRCFTPPNSLCCLSAARMPESLRPSCMRAQTEKLARAVASNALSTPHDAMSVNAQKGEAGTRGSDDVQGSKRGQG